MSVPMPLMSKAKRRPNASRRKLKSIPSCGNHDHDCVMTAPLNTSRAWVSNKPKLVILTPTAAKAVSLRELCFSNETRVVPSINGNNIIIGSTLVSIVVNRSNLLVNLIFQGLQDCKEQPKSLNLESQCEI